jgi:ribosome-interacting GTPase 1
MPANLSPEYLEAEKQYKQARTSDEKLLCLKRMLTTIPKHKGTEKLQADIKKKISKLKQDVEAQARKKGFAVRVEKEGAAQIVVVGAPNSGKTQLVDTLTGVELEVAPYPYTTQRPVPAMMPYENIQIQLVDLPPVSSDHTENWLPNIVRTADAVLLVADLGSAGVLEEIEDCLSVLEAKKVRLIGGKPGDDPWASVAEKQTHIVGTKLDAPEARDNLQIVTELYGDRFQISAVSAVSLENVESLRVEIFRMLELVRVYSKPPQREPEMSKPFVLGRGTTLMEFARVIHHDFAAQLKFARVWGEGKFDGQRVNKDYVLSDGDVIELHI